MAGRQVVVEVLDRRGRIVARSLTLGAKLLPDSTVTRRAAHGHAGFDDVRLSGRPVRLYAAPLPEDRRPRGRRRRARRLRAPPTSSARCTGSACCCCSRGARRRGGRRRRGAAHASRPAPARARVLGGAPRSSAPATPSRRLPDPRADDEVAHLTRALNGMLAALDAARAARAPLPRRRDPRAAHPGHARWRATWSSLARHGVNPEVLADLQLDTARLQRLVDDLLTLERESAGPGARAARPPRRARGRAVAGRDSTRVERVHAR